MHRVRGKAARQGRKQFLKDASKASRKIERERMLGKAPKIINGIYRCP